MGILEKTLELLDEQYEDYFAMQQIGMAQKNCIACQDVDGLNACFERMQHHIDHIYLLQEQMPAGAGDNRAPQVAGRRRKLRSIILQLQELNLANERGVRHLMRGTREELKKFGQGRRATRGYQNIQRQNARFFDGTK